MMLSERVRNSPAGLFTAAALIVFGVAFNRINVFITAYQPPYATQAYVPAIGEIAITVAMISGLVLCYRVIVSVLPVIPSEEAAHAA
jgi:Ni/Fe-hydrogenase subunit HybB-like protein